MLVLPVISVEVSGAVTYVNQPQSQRLSYIPWTTDLINELDQISGGGAVLHGSGDAGKWPSR